MNWIYVPVFLGTVALLSWPAGKMMAWAMSPTATAGNFRVRIDGLLVRCAGRMLEAPHNWKQYCLAMLLVNAFMFVATFGILVLQPFLPLNPDGKGAIEASLIFNTIASFTSNTNLQHYSGEVVMSYFSQIFALMWLQFLSAATGIAALTALARGLRGDREIGNFYMDLLRATFLVLLPIALVVASLVAFLGMPMTFEGAVTVRTLEGATQTIARGPVAAFLSIKQLGTNGGGFFGPNSTHPFENPNFWTNIVSCVSILLIPMASVWMFGRITKDIKHASVIFAVMAALLVTKMTFAVAFETQQSPALVGQPVTDMGVNLEGKELRFGAAAGPVWAVATTSTSNGSVNSMHDSLNPLTGLAPLIGMWLNVTFGGVGVGLINMFLYIVIGVFIAGMMVGRTPAYLTRKVETKEMTLALVALLVHPLFILGGTAIFAATSWGMTTVQDAGSHGFSEILYEFSSATANNGSGFEGLGDNTVPWNIATGTVMLFARFIPIILPIAIAGSLATKKPSPVTIGTFHTDTPLFGFVLAGTVLLVGALLFLPVAVLGPIAEHLAAF